VASLSQNIPHNNDLVPVTCRTTDDLPLHIKGEVYWANHNTCSNHNNPCSGYSLPQEKTPTRQPEAVKFINNAWFGLLINQQEQTYYTQSTLQIPRDNALGAGYWNRP
jgi:hypothetical protein